VSNPAQAQGNRILIRDAETESTIRAYTLPLFEAAGLNPSSVGIKLILNNSLNAFVAGGQNIFLHTGLILNTNNVDEVIGVVAHETGHIAGGHLARTSEAMDDARTLGIVSTILGVSAGILTGRGDLAAAAVSGGSEAAKYSFLKYSRTQESSADQAALSLLESTGMSAQGLYDFLHVLEDNDLLSSARQDPYQRSHPVTRERIAVIENHLTRSRYTDVRPDVSVQLTHDRIRAKLFAYSFPFITTLREYPVTDTSIAARYARAFAYYKKPNLDKALELINELIGEMPDDPYFHELKAEILFNHGQVATAVPEYQLAVNLAPGTALLTLMLGQAQVATEDPAMIEPAIRNLRKSLATEPRTPFAWHQLAIAYGRSGRMGLSTLALAEEALLQRRYKDAIFQAGKAKTLFEEGTKENLQAADILNAAQNAVTQIP
jgi:predicted Zn-dependent protease